MQPFHTLIQAKCIKYLPKYILISCFLKVTLIGAEKSYHRVEVKGSSSSNTKHSCPGKVSGLQCKTVCSELSLHLCKSFLRSDLYQHWSEGNRCDSSCYLLRHVKRSPVISAEVPQRSHALLAKKR